MLLAPLLVLATLAAEPCRAGVCVTAKEDSRSAELVIDNRSAAQAGVTVKYQLTNCSSSAGIEQELTLEPHEKRALTRIQTLGGGWRYHYDYRYVFGRLDAVPDLGFAYALPFTPGTAHKLVQGENGTYTHNGDVTFAYDFEMPEGTPVLAAREGIVVDIQDQNTERGETDDWKDRANYVFVLHADGTLGQYLHLQPHGVRVAVGDRVAVGQQLGLSGNTGQSKGPHLHFEVNRRAAIGRRMTLPAKFRLRAGGEGVRLATGQRYTAP